MLTNILINLLTYSNIFTTAFSETHYNTFAYRMLRGICKYIQHIIFHFTFNYINQFLCLQCFN